MDLTYELIEQWFNILPKFGSTSVLEIESNGLGIDKIMLQFTLPDLPLGLRYKQFQIYDLINTISLMVGEQQIFHFNSTQLSIFDKVERNINTITKCGTSREHTFMYLIDLKPFFKGSRSNILMKNSDLDLDFEGIRLVDCHEYKVKFILQLNTIHNIVVCAERYHDILSTLQLYETKPFITYVNKHVLPQSHTMNDNIDTSFIKVNNNGYFNWLSNIFCGPEVEYPIKEKQITQKLNRWTGNEFTIDKESDEFSFLMQLPKTPTSQIIFHSDSLKKIHKFSLQLNGQDYFSNVNLEHHQIIYEYNHNKMLGDNIFIVTIPISGKDDTLKFSAKLIDSCTNFKMTYMYQVENKLIYQ